MHRLVFVAIFASLLTSCGGGGHSTASSTEQPLFGGSATGTEQPLFSGSSASTSTAAPITGSARALLGVWKEVSDTAGNTLETCQFNEDGSLACTSGNGQDQVGQWSQVDSDHIDLSYGNADATVEYHIDGKKLTVIFSDATPPYTQVYEKE
jgi:hypothetical protein